MSSPPARSFLQSIFTDLKESERGNRLSDFTISWRVLPISLLAMVIGVLAACVSLALLRLIDLFTNIFFFGRWTTQSLSPADNHLGAWVIVIPAAGALIVGIMARYGSERIRGHGIPEALEAILLRGSKVAPRVAVLKPISAAVSIGSGGPFGAEGPIIMTGGALGSLIAQLGKLTNAERKTLLAAGAAAGMSATFDSPIASVLLAVELLLFESKPRSLIPVALASATAAFCRYFLLGPGPLFHVPLHAGFLDAAGLAGCAAIGLMAGVSAALLTLSVYKAEDAFARLPIHWMWWPALGGLAVGLGGWFVPQALGVGYGVIEEILQGNAPLHLLLGILAIKWVIWAIALGSGTSGGVLAPLLMIGGALGGLAAGFLPDQGAGFWPLVSMAAVLGGALRVPLTAIVFCMEVTSDFHILLPLLVAVTVAYGFTVLALPRSILTEKLARRGHHLSHESESDPLELIFVRDVMRTRVLTLPAEMEIGQVAGHISDGYKGQRLYPVVSSEGSIVGVTTRSDVDQAVRDGRVETLARLARLHPSIAFPDETLRSAAHRMAKTGLTRLLVVERENTGRLVGMITLKDLLKGRKRQLEEERERERVLRLRMPLLG
jgi:H+/Cl- antiporter ClcA